MFKRKTSH